MVMVLAVVNPLSHKLSNCCYGGTGQTEEASWLQFCKIKCNENVNGLRGSRCIFSTKLNVLSFFRSTLLPGNFSPRRTRRQTIVMSVPVVNISEEMDELPEAEDAVTSEVVSAKSKLQNGSSASVDVSKEIEVELMKAPSKRAVRASAKAMKNGKSAKLPSKLPTVAEKSSESRRRGRKPKKDKKQTSKSKVSN